MTRIPIRGNQYATGHYGKILPATALTPSMSRKSKCRNNAPRESFFGTLKTGPVHQRETPTAMPPAATRFPTANAMTILGRATPPSVASPRSRQTAKPHNPISTSQAEGQFALVMEAGALPVVRSNPTHPQRDHFDRAAYPSRHKVENLWAKLKEWRATATRYDKTAKSFTGGLYLAAASQWLS